MKSPTVLKATDIPKPKVKKKVTRYLIDPDGKRVKVRVPVVQSAKETLKGTKYEDG